MDSLISFAPLAALPHLRALFIHGSYRGEFTDAQVDELRALPRLHSLDIFPLWTSVRRRLLAHPHDLLWQRMSLPSELSDVDAALLPQLPSLTELSFNAEKLTNFDFLRQLPNLTLLRCSSCGGDEDLDDVELADQLVAGLRHCTNITRLWLSDIWKLTSAHLVDLLPRLPQLRELRLDNLRINSLGFLAQAPMTSQLTALRLSRCRNLPLADLRHLHSLRELRELNIDGSFDEQMELDCESLTALRLPSAALPLLESFTFGARDFEAESEVGLELVFD